MSYPHDSQVNSGLQVKTQIQFKLNTNVCPFNYYFQSLSLTKQPQATKTEKQWNKNLFSPVIRYDTIYRHLCVLHGYGNNISWAAHAQHERF